MKMFLKDIMICMLQRNYSREKFRRKWLKKQHKRNHFKNIKEYNKRRHKKIRWSKIPSILSLIKWAKNSNIREKKLIKDKETTKLFKTFSKHTQKLKGMKAKENNKYNNNIDKNWWHKLNKIDKEKCKKDRWVIRR